MTLINFWIELNVINCVYAVKLGFCVRKADISTRKIDKLFLETYGMVIAIFQVLNNFICLQFFKKTFQNAEIRI